MDVRVCVRVCASVVWCVCGVVFGPVYSERIYGSCLRSCWEYALDWILEARGAKRERIKKISGS
ncbi:hypothetical protein DENSPDRAFT_834756 [Dentipellis sp. KUC8613]|nr:hypothetical protein DENSPDRAFT_834756 [Dentipellis sp. KUC8613]